MSLRTHHARSPPYTANRLKWMRRLLGHTLRYRRPQLSVGLSPYKANTLSGPSGWLGALRRVFKLRLLLVAIAAVTAYRRLVLRP
jgi:hypothetical protein